MSQMRLVILFISSLIISGCAENQLIKTIKTFQSAVIQIPNDLMVVENKSISNYSDTLCPIKMLVFFDSSCCSACQIKRLSDYCPLFDQAKISNRYDVMILFSPLPEICPEVIELLFMANYPYPVYIDHSGSFSEINKHIPEDNRFHSFLLNKEGHPVFVGNPLASDRMMELFKEALESLE